MGVLVSKCFILIAGIAIGATLALAYSSWGVYTPRNDEIRRASIASSALVSPLLGCADLPQAVSDSAISALQSKLSDTIAAETKKGTIRYASLYFRDLSNGPWFGINESDSFSPASLLKVPLAMSFYLRSEDDPAVLNATTTYIPDPSVVAQTQPFGPSHPLVAGESYTVCELIEHMLEESSNESAAVLNNLAGKKQVEDHYTDLGLISPTPGQDYKLSTHNYASFFRILYNATYLDPQNSAALLTLLTKTTFKDGLVAGVPSGVTVAHKFGSRQVDSLGAVLQLHDCGIVYAPHKPYVLCIMTQGSDFPTLADFIKGISHTVYSAVTSS